MADGSQQGGNDNIATDELATLNGVPAAPDVDGKQPKAQRAKVGYGPEASFQDVDEGHGLPVAGTLMQELTESMRAIADVLSMLRDPTTGRMRTTVESSTSVVVSSAQSLQSVSTVAPSPANSFSLYASYVEMMQAGADALRRQIVVS